MTTAYASGKHAFGFCDICGFRARLNDMKPLVVNQRPTKTLTCRSCNDKDHPQLRLGRVKIYDPQALRNPRPDVNLAESNAVVVNLTNVASTGYTGTVVTVNNVVVGT